MVAVTTAGRLDMHKSLPNFRELLLNPRGDMVGVLCFEMVYELLYLWHFWQCVVTGVLWYKHVREFGSIDSPPESRLGGNLYACRHVEPSSSGLMQMCVTPGDAE